MARVAHLGERRGGRRGAAEARRFRRRRRIIAALVLGGMLAGGWGLARSPLFALSSIEVAGAQLVPAEQIIAASGLRPGQSVLGIDGRAVAERLGAMGHVREARVERVGLSSVRIVVSERRPVLRVDTEGGRFFVDQDGIPIEAAVPADSLPVLRMPGAGLPVAAVVGEEGMAGLAAAGAVARLWRALPADLRSDIRWFEASSPASIRFRWGEVDVLFGDGGQARLKVEALRLVARRVASDGERLLRVDVRAPRRPAAAIA